MTWVESVSILLRFWPMEPSDTDRVFDKIVDPTLRDFAIDFKQKSSGAHRQVVSHVRVSRIDLESAFDQDLSAFEFAVGAPSEQHSSKIESTHRGKNVPFDIERTQCTAS